MEYNVPLFEKSRGCFENAEKARIDSFHWEREGFSRPESYVCIYAEEKCGIHIKLWSFEENIRCECVEKNSPIYTDSCLEVFLMPVKNDTRYINFEVNPNGVYLSEIGTCRKDRVFISKITDIEPVITPFSFSEGGKTAWGFEIFIPDSLVCAVYGINYSTEETVIKGNFYKCADLSAAPHYGALFPVTAAELGFHNPDCFGNIIFKKGV